MNGVTLGELEELVGEYKGISTTPLFTEIEVGNHVITLDNGNPNSKAIVKRLQQVQKGTEIGILRVGGALRVRKSEGNK